MEKSYWSSRWVKNKIGFHSPEQDPSLVHWWSNLNIASSSTVFVPLCGKSPDMDWLVDFGYRVIGVEFVEKACVDFFDERGLVPKITQKSGMTIYSHGPVEIWCADIHSVPDSVIQNCAAIYDRAALVALPPRFRQAYIQKVYGNALQPQSGLLISFTYDNSVMSGPPFSIAETEIRALFKDIATVEILESADIIDSLVKFKNKGLGSMWKTVYRLVPHPRFRVAVDLD